jgi:hypothetical protein
MQVDRVLKGTIMAVALLVVTVNSRAGMLDGTTCKVKVTPNLASADKSQQPFDDTLSFANGKFTSKTFLAKGFKPGVTRGEEEKNEAEFEVEQTNDTGQVINWQGAIRGKQCTGSMHWKMKDGAISSFYFNGTKE